MSGPSSAAREWARRRVAAHLPGAGIIVVDDPDGLVDDGEWEVVATWWQLRAAYERSGRRSTDRVVLVRRPPVVHDPLPWDIGERSAVVHARLPGSAAVRIVLATLDGGAFASAVTAIGAGGDAEARLVEVLTSSSVRGGMDLAAELHLTARLLAAGVDAGSLATRWVTTPALAAVLRIPRDPSRLRSAWRAAVHGEDPAWELAFRRCRADIPGLVAAGVLEPVTVVGDHPSWAVPGVRLPTDAERAERLLNDLPPDPATRSGWETVATWWSEVRVAVARAGVPALADRAWREWGRFDLMFRSWLQTSYGTELTSARPWPASVHRIADFLARRVDNGTRVVLVVLDGLGLAQWRHLVDHAGLVVEDEGITMALVPTWTSVSRQAIAAGRLPSTFRDLWSTADERVAWRSYWRERGLADHEILHRVVAGRPTDEVLLGSSRAAMVVAGATDELMHTAELLGDAQLLAGIDVWMATRWLTDLIAHASSSGAEVWITADHGNLECDAAGSPRDGLGADAAGKRLLRFRTAADRAASGTDGLDWDGIPGLPASAPVLRFAPGRRAYTDLPLSVSHGGLSFDEVFVPLARVSA